MKRRYTLNPFNLHLSPKAILSLCKSEYVRRYPNKILSKKNPFASCIVYLVINQDKTIKLDFKFQQESPLQMKFIHKRPKGARQGEEIRNIDIREITNISIPPYENRYYFDFIFFILDITTDEYWATNFWTMKVCPDLRYYLSRARKQKYREISGKLARIYNLTFTLGHVNLKTGKLRSSSGIKKIIKHGWIPTISLLPQPYHQMIRIIELTNDIDQVNANALELFNVSLLDNIIERWNGASLVRDRQELLSIAIDRFKSNDFISTIYILLPQIEGLVTEHIKRKRKGKILESDIKKRFIQFGNLIKGERFNTKFTCYLTNILVTYLANTFYKKWYPYPKSGRRYRQSTLSPQRHVILHGEVDPKYFTAENCLKLICILDAIILLSLKSSELPVRK